MFDLADRLQSHLTVRFTPSALDSPGTLVAASASTAVIRNETTTTVGSSKPGPSAQRDHDERDRKDHRLVQQEERHRRRAEPPRYRCAELPKAHPDAEGPHRPRPCLEVEAEEVPR
jgi:hypothetical protein